MAWLYGQAEGQWKIWLLRGAHMRQDPMEITMVIWGYIKIGYVNTHQEPHFPGLGDNRNQEVGFLLYSLETNTQVQEMSGP